MRIRTCLVLATLLLATSAWAVPAQLAHQGRLLDAESTPLEGQHTLDFALYDALIGGAAVWSESVDITLVGGFYSAVLGADEQDNPLDDLVLGNPPLWLELTVDDGEPLAPRHELLSVPYAVLAGTATNVEGGYVDATEVAIDGTTVIDGEGNWVGPVLPVAWDDVSGVPSGLEDGEDADTLAGLVCADGARPRWDGPLGSWACDGVSWGEVQGVPAEFADGDADTLGSISPCADGAVAKFNAVSGLWACGVDAVLGSAEVLAYVGGTTLDLGAGSSMDGVELATLDNLNWGTLTDIPPEFVDGLDADTFATLGPTCADGDRPVWDDGAGEWSCGRVSWNEVQDLPEDLVDGDSDELATLGPCADGEVPKWDSSDGSWHCAQDEGTATLADSLYVSQGSQGNNNYTRVCDPGDRAVGGGCSCFGINNSAPVGDTGWNCSCGGSGVTTYVICLDLTP